MPLIPDAEPQKNTSVRKMPLIPDAEPQKNTSVRKNAPYPGRRTTKKHFCPEKHPLSRTQNHKKILPSGKQSMIPDGSTFPYEKGTVNYPATPYTSTINPSTTISPTIKRSIRQ